MMHGQKNIKLKLLRVATFCTSGSEEVVYTHTHTHTHIYIYGWRKVRQTPNKLGEECRAWHSPFRLIVLKMLKMDNT